MTQNKNFYVFFKPEFKRGYFKSTHSKQTVRISASVLMRAVNRGRS